MIAPPPRRDERRSRGIGEPRQRRDVEVDHLLHGVDVGLQKRLERADTRIVDQHRDAGIGGEDRLDPLQIRLVVEVGGDGFDDAAGRAGDALRHLVQPSLVACDEDEVVAAAGQPVGIDRADSGGGSCHDCDAFGGGRHGSFSCSVAPAGAWVSFKVFSMLSTCSTPTPGRRETPVMRCEMLLAVARRVSRT